MTYWPNVRTTKQRHSLLNGASIKTVWELLLTPGMKSAIILLIWQVAEIYAAHIILLFTHVCKGHLERTLTSSLILKLSASRTRAGLAFMEVADIISCACFTPEGWTHRPGKGWVTQTLLQRLFAPARVLSCVPPASSSVARAPFPSYVFSERDPCCAADWRHCVRKSTAWLGNLANGLISAKLL